MKQDRDRKRILVKKKRPKIFTIEKVDSAQIIYVIQELGMNQRGTIQRLRAFYQAKNLPITVRVLKSDRK